MPESLPRIERIESSSVDAIGYDPAGGKLYVRFIGSGRAYVYRGVPEAVYRSLMRAESKGRFVNQRIKGAYDYRQL